MTCFIFIFTSFLCNGRVMLPIPRRVNKTWVIWLMAGGFFSYLELWIVDENSFVFSASLSSRLRVVTGINPQGYCYLYLYCILYNCQIKTVALIVLVFFSSLLFVFVTSILLWWKFVMLSLVIFWCCFVAFSVIRTLIVNISISLIQFLWLLFLLLLIALSLTLVFCISNL